MKLVTHIFIYVVLVVYIGLMQFIIFGYEQMNGGLQHEIDKMKRICLEIPPDPSEDLHEKYYEN